MLAFNCSLEEELAVYIEQKYAGFRINSDCAEQIIELAQGIKTPIILMKYICDEEQAKLDAAKWKCVSFAHVNIPGSDIVPKKELYNIIDMLIGAYNKL